MGIFRNFGKTANQLQKELEDNDDETLSYALPNDWKENGINQDTKAVQAAPSNPFTKSSGLFDNVRSTTNLLAKSTASKAKKEAPNQAMQAELDKKQVLEWHLFKSGLMVP